MLNFLTQFTNEIVETVKEDIVGKKSLEILEKADNYIRLSTLEISQHLDGKVLELGSGNGNLTQHLAFNHEITALDIQPQYLEALKNKVHFLENQRGIKSKNFTTAQANLMQEPPQEFINQFDTILSCQVLEHLEDDYLVLKNYVRCLKPNGKVVLQLPAHMFAYNILDKNLGHFRRYDHKSVSTLLRSVGLEVEQTYYFNFFGLLGWIWAGSILKKQILPEGQIGIFNLIAPIVIKLDTLFSRICGLNIIAIAKKSDLKL